MSETSLPPPDSLHKSALVLDEASRVEILMHLLASCPSVTLRAPTHHLHRRQRLRNDRRPAHRANLASLSS